MPFKLFPMLSSLREWMLRRFIHETMTYRAFPIDTPHSSCETQTRCPRMWKPWPAGVEISKRSSSFVHHIFDPTALHTNEVMVYGDVSVRTAPPRAPLTSRNQSGFP